MTVARRTSHVTIPPSEIRLHLPSRSVQVASDLETAMNAPGEALAPAALAIARVEYPSLDADGYMEALERMGDEAAGRVARAGVRGRTPSPCSTSISTTSSASPATATTTTTRATASSTRCSNRRTGIPITLAVIYLEVARRAGVARPGVNFPGHFLLRAADERARLHYSGDFLIVDPFHGGALLSEIDCREMLRQHVGEEAAFDRDLLQPATRHEIVVRMLVNLKRLYVRMRSFPQARFVADLLLTVDPSAVSELRDRGLLAYHLQDFGAALRDLESYLRLLPRQIDEPMASEIPGEPADDLPDGDENGNESLQVWEHIKNLRKRVAGFN